MSDDELVVSTQFSIIESHAYAEKIEQKFHFKVRNILNGRIFKGLAMGWSTYIPHSHADIAAILGHWNRLMSSFVADAAMLSFLCWPADFASAYRKMPHAVLHINFLGFVYYDYEHGGRRYVFYLALPFGRALAPAEWSETCVAISHLFGIILLLILTYCVDDA